MSEPSVWREAHPKIATVRPADSSFWYVASYEGHSHLQIFLRKPLIELALSSISSKQTSHAGAAGPIQMNLTSFRGMNTYKLGPCWQVLLLKFFIFISFYIITEISPNQMCKAMGLRRCTSMTLILKLKHGHVHSSYVENVLEVSPSAIYQTLHGCVCCGVIFLYTVNMCHSDRFNKKLKSQQLGRTFGTERLLGRRAES